MYWVFEKSADIPFLVMGSITSTGFYYNISQRFSKFILSIQNPKFIAKTSSSLAREKHAKWPGWEHFYFGLL